MTVILQRDLDLNSICRLHKLHQRNNLAEIMCLGQRTPKKRLQLWFNSYVFVLPHGGHLGFMGQNDAKASN